MIYNFSPIMKANLLTLLQDTSIPADTLSKIFPFSSPNSTHLRSLCLSVLYCGCVLFCENGCAGFLQYRVINDLGIKSSCSQPECTATITFLAS